MKSFKKIEKITTLQINSFFIALDGYPVNRYYYTDSADNLMSDKFWEVYLVSNNIKYSIVFENPKLQQLFNLNINSKHTILTPIIDYISISDYSNWSKFKPAFKNFDAIKLQKNCSIINDDIIIFNDLIFMKPRESSFTLNINYVQNYIYQFII